MHEQALWSPFPIEEFLAQPSYRGDGIGPDSDDVTDFVDPPWEASPSLGSGWGG